MLDRSLDLQQALLEQSGDSAPGSGLVRGRAQPLVRAPDSYRSTLTSNDFQRTGLDVRETGKRVGARR
jgi:hypothetical protein